MVFYCPDIYFCVLSFRFKELFFVLDFHKVEPSHKNDDSHGSTSLTFYYHCLFIGSTVGARCLVSVVNGQKDEVAYRPKPPHAKTMTSCVVLHKYMNH